MTKLKQRPSFDQLLALNPLLQKRTHGELESLLDAIEECGYSWDASQMMFYNSEISRGIRTQELDIFTTESFREAHLRLKQEEAEHRLRQIGTNWFLRFIGVIFFWGIFGLCGILGWISIQWQTWLLMLLGIIVAYVCVFFYYVIRYKGKIRQDGTV